MPCGSACRASRSIVMGRPASPSAGRPACPSSRDRVTQPAASHVWLNGRLLPSEVAHLSTYDRGFMLGDAVFEAFRAKRGVAIELDGHLAKKEHLEPGRDGPGHALRRRGDCRRDLGPARRRAGWGRGRATRRRRHPPYRQSWLRRHEGRAAPPGRDRFGGHPGLAVQSAVRGYARGRPPGRHERDPARSQLAHGGHQDHGPRGAGLCPARGRAGRRGRRDLPDHRRPHHRGHDVQRSADPRRRRRHSPPGNGATGRHRASLAHGARRERLCAPVEQDLRPLDAFEADEAAICSSIAGVVPVVALDNRPIGNGTPGPRTLALRAARESWIDLHSLEVAGARGRASSPAGGLGR